MMNKFNYPTLWSYYSDKLKCVNYWLNQYPKGRKLLKRKFKYEQIVQNLENS